MSKKDNINFSKEASYVLELLEKSNKNIFITGKAGTGKSTLLSYFREVSKKKPVVLAPTGVAAINVDGETIHSFFKLKPGFELEEAKHKSYKAKNSYKNLNILIIDEISMVRADLLDAIDIVLRIFKKNNEPFGGVRMILFGDLYQLPPVLTKDDREKFKYEGYNSPYFFSAKVFEPKDNLFNSVFELEIVELLQIYRQKDEDFIEILNQIRNKSIKDDGLEKLNKRVEPSTTLIDDEGYIYLVPTNRDAALINNSKLEKLSDKNSKTFYSNINGKVPKNFYPNSIEVELKIGSQVMFIQNDSKRRWVNGTIGTVVDIKEESELDDITDNLIKKDIVVVKKEDNQIVKVGFSSWEISKYVFKSGEFQREILGSFEQIPLKLSWAITIHKSQGKTFKKAIIDFGDKSFTHGQTYVALSRCTSLDGLILTKKLNLSHIIMDKRVSAFMSKYKFDIANKNLNLESKILILEDAIKNKNKVVIDYLKGKDNQFVMKVEPIGISKESHKGSSFMALKAFCEQNSTKIFSIKRILNIRLEN
jgi:hypothetical protein